MTITSDEEDIPVKLTSEFFLSSMIAATIVLILTTSAGPAIVNPLLLDGSLISNGRYAFIYDGYETIKEDEGATVVGIGSSVIMAAMNGTCMEEKSATEGAKYYNFGISGGKPYTEMMQIPALIEARPDVVILEIGPNSLYGWDVNGEPKGNSEYNSYRFQLSAMQMSNKHIGGWYDVLDSQDKKKVDTTILGKSDSWSEYFPAAIEELLKREITGQSSAKYEDNSYAKVPQVGSQEWYRYLSEPNYHISRYEGKSDDFVRSDIDKHMPRMINEGYYSPQYSDTQNHRALDYIIHELLNASVDILIVGIPHHPWVNLHLEKGQLKGMNLTYEKYSGLDGVTTLQMYWEDWTKDAFDDRLHMDHDGREMFCSRLTPIIDTILDGRNYNQISR